MGSALDEGIQLCKNSSFAEAIEKLKEHLLLEPANISAHNYLAISYGQTRQYEEAIGEFLFLTRLEPGNATHCYNLGLAYEAFGNDLQATGAYQKALQIRPDYQKAIDSLSALKAKQPRIDATQIAAPPANYPPVQPGYQASPYQQAPYQQPPFQAPSGSYAVSGQALPIVDNTLVWIMAFVPLISTFGEILFGDNVALGYFISILISLMMYIPSIVFDERRLKAQGFDTQSLQWWWLLIPVWLFKRAHLVGGGSDYAVTWVAVLVISLLIGHT